MRALTLTAWAREITPSAYAYPSTIMKRPLGIGIEPIGEGAPMGIYAMDEVLLGMIVPMVIGASMGMPAIGRMPVLSMGA